MCFIRCGMTIGEGRGGARARVCEASSAGSNYASRHDARRGETLEIRSLPGATIAASDILLH
jgi:hypothetical protein